MPYQHFAKQPIEAMKSPLTALRKTIDDMKKDKKSDKKKIAELEKKYATDSAAIAKKFNDDLKSIKATFTTMSLQIEAYMTEAMKSMQTLKTALAEYQKTHANDKKMVLDGGPAHLKSIYEAASKEMNEHAASWNEYREFNPGCDPKLVTEGGALRTGIIETTKSLRAKVVRLQALAGEAEGYKAAAADAGSLVLATPEDKLAEAQALYDRLHGMAQPMMTGSKQTIESVLKNRDSMKTNVTSMPANELANAMKMLEGICSSNASVVQGFTSTVTAMRRTLTTAAPAFPAMYTKDQHIAAKLKEASDLVVHYEGEIKKTQAALVEMNALLNEARTKAAKAKKK